MMKLYIKNDLVSIRGGSKVTDEAGAPVYEVKGKLFSPTHKKFIKDLNGKILYSVRNKWFNFLVPSAYVYDENKEKILRLKKKFAVRNTFYAQGYHDEITIDGDFLSLTLTIYKNGAVVGSLRKEFFKLADTFVLEANEEDMALCAL